MFALITAPFRVRSATHLPRKHPPQAAPSLRTRCRASPPSGWPMQPRAHYYFDATWHTAQTLRRLIRANLAMDDLGLSKPPELLAQAMDSLLHSICPGLPDDATSRYHHRQLLHAHLSGLGADELGQLSRLLKTQGFGCAVTESVVDDAMLEEHGFANGPPHQRQRVVMTTGDLHHALDDAALASGANERRRDASSRLAPSQARQARELLAACAQRHADKGITLKEFTGIAGQFADAVGLAIKPSDTVAATPLPPVSCIDWQQELLIIDLCTLTALIGSGDRGLYAVVLRDLLELLLARKLFGQHAELLKLDAGQRSLLFREIEQVLALPPSPAEDAMRSCASRVLAGGIAFGTVQVCPTAGVPLGHAWIAPVLSVAPDKGRGKREIGTRYMRSGFRLEPVQCSVSEWEMRWLSARESEELYPASHAWHLPVPAHRLKLQQAAAELMQEWRGKALPYRFIGTEPGMPATGCRVTVWQTVQRAMDDDARMLFTHFTLGLPEPESPTELALRLEQFMQWLGALAAPDKAGSTNL